MKKETIKPTEEEMKEQKKKIDESLIRANIIQVESLGKVNQTYFKELQEIAEQIESKTKEVLKINFDDEEIERLFEGSEIVYQFNVTDYEKKKAFIDEWKKTLKKVNNNFVADNFFLLFSHLIEQVQGGYQEGNMEWRANRKDASGNKQRFAKYAGATVFAPLIFTIPFPTMVRPFDGQNVQQLLNGGNFIKNIVSIFTIFALVVLLMSGKWRDHMLPLSFLIGYLVVLVFSAFAQSERFHQPAMPFEMMFAACGISIVMTNKRYQRWFIYWCVLMFVAAIAWNWFKLAGRGMI